MGSGAAGWPQALAIVVAGAEHRPLGDYTLGHFARAAGLGVAAFTSAAVGMLAGVALVRPRGR